MKIEVSVIIPTYQRQEILVKTISHLLDQKSRDVEIIIVDQTERNDAETTSRLAQWNDTGSIRWIRPRNPSIPRSMNIGTKIAKGAFLLFLDDDIIPDKQLIESHASAHNRSHCGLIAGRVLQPWHGEEHDSDPFTQREPGHKEEFMGGNFSIRRELLMQLGGFDQNFKGAAYRFEREFADRLLSAGHCIWYEPAALIRHLHFVSGGTRSKGDHLTSWNPRHPVGAYYYLFSSSRVSGPAWSAARRLVRSVMTRHHLRKPWYIPVTLISETLGLCWALALKLRGAALPFREALAADEPA